MTRPEPDTLRDEILRLAQTELGVEVESLEGDLSETLDSMQRLAFVVALEDHFEICFEPEDDQAARTVEEVVRLLQAKLAARGSDAG